MSDPEDPTAHEIIVLSPLYHLSVHFPQGSMYADVWLGTSNKTHDLLLHLSELRRKALNTSPIEEIATSPLSAASSSSELPSMVRSHSRSSSTTATAASPPSTARKDSVCDNNNTSPPQMCLSTRRSSHGLFNCPPGTRPADWLVAKESLFAAHSICQNHHAKFNAAVGKIQKYHQGPRPPSLEPLQSLLDDLLAKNKQDPGPIDSPACCICSASPYTRLFFSML
ncbi:hypothetical protein GGI25_005721 [Coemansia spiralis]|uniref:Uncharacterized protein n=2 Tax=Coemansia TaxID=4863 RepID=A0A9W8G2Q5_9FUNG|nr:hypothetical protein BX070DRAFT_237374 [Coemansia spiralis]KAJ1988670.1 hypothetical protein EDC05_005145 [Coemansia umbellata]KAJ2619870.1 hypothetical protein GGI26_005489 [Coemansia sp. RSA 1358]KAJ2670802.1 hypothetical protein GGI25_005721 [Coemansia spiralis]